MKRWALVLVCAATALFAASCYEATANHENEFTTGSREDCTMWHPGSYEFTGSEFYGVDLLIAVDNSESMGEEQNLLSSGLYSLINSLTKPLRTDPSWGYDSVDNLRVAVVSSDLGLMYGEDHETASSPTDMPTCEKLTGDDGNFLTTPIGISNIGVADNTIRCEEEGRQCPEGWSCRIAAGQTVGLCTAPGSTTVGCGAALTEENTSTTFDDPNDALATQSACMVQQGTEGCRFSQPLEASLYGLEKHPEFIDPGHLLAVLIVSDAEDCSMADSTLFTPEWSSVACSAGGTDASYLFPTSRYFERFKELKGGKDYAVFFAAVVGVPTAAESMEQGMPLCEGDGDEIYNCLDDDNTLMQLLPMEYTVPETDTTYTYIPPACQREDPMNPGTYVTQASPGRRYVETAKHFGGNGFVYSICNEDWTPAMEAVAKPIASSNQTPLCLPEKWEWKALPADEQPAYCPDGNCGEPTCDAVFRIQRGLNDGEACPESIYAALTDSEKNAYLKRKVVEPIESPATGEITGKSIFCVLPKLPAPVDCTAARAVIDRDEVGWYYCENSGEDFRYACEDGIDNDEDGRTDCDDNECADCSFCDGIDASCDTDKCSYNPVFTDAAKRATSSYFVTFTCLQNSELGSGECNSTENAALGSTCTQPGYSDREEDIAYWVGGVLALSFQKGCDCMTYSTYAGYDNSYMSHFCTRPCSTEKQDCPSGFTCEEAFNDTFDVPGDLPSAYCVPDCLAASCEDADAQCVPTSASGEHWACE